jgi:DUF438 domain-containing protein
MGTLHEDLFTFMIRNVSDRSSRENQNTHFVHKMFSKNCAICEITPKKYARARQATDRSTAQQMKD